MRHLGSGMRKPCPPDVPFAHVMEVIQQHEDGTPINDLLGKVKGKDLIRVITSLQPFTPEFAAARRFADALGAAHPAGRDGFAIRDTSGYWWTEEDLEHEQASIIDLNDGRQVIRFPIAWPWKIKPSDIDPEGLRGEPTYRSFEPVPMG